MGNLSAVEFLQNEMLRFSISSKEDHMFFVEMFVFCWNGYFVGFTAKMIVRNSYPEKFLEKGVLKIYSKFTGEHQC